MVEPPTRPGFASCLCHFFSEPVSPSVKWASVQLLAFTRGILRTEVSGVLGTGLNKWLLLFYYYYC